MMNNNKILTVSYGTFSCTLEGFDDSFGTMKAIAEYFRDLAADDRYFGAEPPQPDAEMLARIAQKEISRRVEARQHDGRIVLSAHAHEAGPVAADPAEPAEAPAPLAKAPLEDAVAQSPAPAAEPVQERQVTEGKGTESDAAAQVETAESAVAEADVAEVETDAKSPVAAQDADEADATDIVPGQPDDAIEAFFADSPKQDFLSDDASEADAAAEASAAAVSEAGATARSPADSIAAKLQRIRAVVSQQQAEDEAPDYSEDEHADAPAAAAPLYASDEDEFEEGETDNVTEARAHIEAALDADDDIASQPVASFDEDEADDITAILNRLDAADARDLEDDARVDEETAGAIAQADFDKADEDKANDADALAAVHVEESEDAPAPVHTDDLSDGTEDDIAAHAQDENDADADDADDAVDNLFGDDTIAAHATDATSEDDSDVESDEDSAVAAEADVDAPADDDDTPAEDDHVASVLEDVKAAAPRARVIKIKRADLEAAIAKGELEEYSEDEDELDAAAAAQVADDDAASDAAPLAETSTLSAEDEDDLARELAAVVAEDHAADDAEADSAEKAQHARRALPTPVDEKGPDMNRLLAETDHQMDEPESATRRDAFAHLRAAVAAKKADEALGAQDDADETNDAYRSDLAEVVKPRRPVSGSARTERPEEARPAPLKLVAEQRIDTDRVRTEGPVRPRRIAAVQEMVSTASDAESFADFAADMGATKLPQLLEAAAAYMSFVEGREQFSRPQLMTKVRQAEVGEFSREDGLRSFGQLLRAGKIEKLKGGRFTVSEEIGYRPDHRAAG